MDGSTVIPTFTIDTTVCSACGHQHAGPEVANICVGCPCDGPRYEIEKTSEPSTTSRPVVSDSTRDASSEPWDERLLESLQPRLDESDAVWVVEVVQAMVGAPLAAEARRLLGELNSMTIRWETACDLLSERTAGKWAAEDEVQRLHRAVEDYREQANDRYRVAERVRTALYGTDWRGVDSLAMRDALRQALEDDDHEVTRQGDATVIGTLSVAVGKVNQLHQPDEDGFCRACRTEMHPCATAKAIGVGR